MNPETNKGRMSPFGVTQSHLQRLSTLIVGLSVVATLLGSRRVLSDWDFFAGISKLLFGSEGLQVYGNHVKIQSGPLSLIVIRVLSLSWLDHIVVRTIAFGAIELVAISWVRRTRTLSGLDQRGLDTCLVIGALVTAFWWTQLKIYGHIDDALVIMIFTACLYLVIAGRRVSPAILVGLAIAVKPWAVFLLPLTMDRDARGVRKFRWPMVSAAVAGVCWAPFILATSRTLDGMRPVVKVARDSVVHLVGFDDQSIPSWVRLVQFISAILVATVAVWRGRYAGVLFAGIGVRLVTDPATWDYYTAGFIFGALVWDLCATNRRVPVFTLLTASLMMPSWVVANPDLRALLRLVACLVAISVVSAPLRRRSEMEATAAQPTDQCSESLQPLAVG